MRRPALIALLAAATLAFPAGAAAALTPFQTPSRQIVCLYVTEMGPAPLIRCDLRFLNDRAVVLPGSGRARLLKVTDAVGDPGAPVLRYGSSRRFGRFTCTSRSTGLTCRHRGNGHGFTVRRASQRVY